MNEKIIMYDSPEAAQPCTINGWKSSHGYFYPHENTARYDGCTHRACEKCGKPAQKLYSMCEECKAQKHKEKRASLERVEWDGPVYSETVNQYFSSFDDVYDYIEENSEDGLTIESLELYTCKPHRPVLDVSDLVCPFTEDDINIPKELTTAIDEFNEKVKDIILSWSPDNKVPIPKKML